jgi:hypothetical protein
MNLTSANFVILLAIYKALYAFTNTSVFASPEVLRERHGQVVSELRKLEAAFPEVAKDAKSYYDDEDMDFPEFNEDYKNQLFSLLLNLHIFTDSAKISEVSASVEAIREPLVFFASWFDDFDSEVHFC